MSRVLAYAVVFFLIGNFCGQLSPYYVGEMFFYNGVLLTALGVGEGIAAWRRRRKRGEEVTD